MQAERVVPRVGAPPTSLGSGWRCSMHASQAHGRARGPVAAAHAARPPPSAAVRQARQHSSASVGRMRVVRVGKASAGSSPVKTIPARQALRLWYGLEVHTPLDGARGAPSVCFGGYSGACQGRHQRASLDVVIGVHGPPSHRVPNPVSANRRGVARRAVSLAHCATGASESCRGRARPARRRGRGRGALRERGRTFDLRPRKEKDYQLSIKIFP